MNLHERLQDLVLEFSLPEPDYFLRITPDVELLLAYPDERAGLVAAPGPPAAAAGGWRLFPCDPEDAAALRAAVGALAVALGYIALPEAAQGEVAATGAGAGPAPARPRRPDPTDQQRAAIAHGSGPARILAGAGTGKTTVVVGRFHHLVQQGVAPDRILILTFSREAARSLRDAVLPDLRAGTRLWVSTFHSFCLKVLEAEAPAGLRLVQEPERRAILEGACAGQTWAWYAGARAGRLAPEALTLIGQAKDHLLTPEHVAGYAAHAGDPRLADLAQAYRRFQAELVRQGAAEFSDFIFQAVDLLERDAAVAARWQGRFDHILVDEFQDTNLAQFRVLQLLTRPHGNLVVVGDDDQAIYHFRGATDRFMVHLPRYYPDATTYGVTENFRCPQPVLDVANRLIARNGPERVGKTLITRTKVEGYPPVRHWEALTEREEAEAVAAEVARQMSGGGRAPGDFAILCRSVRRSAGEFARALARRGIPYRLVGEESEHPAVAQTLALLRLTRALTGADLLQVLAGRLPPADLNAALRESAGDLPGLLTAGQGPERFRPAAADLLAWLGAQTGRPPAEQVYAALRYLGHLRLSLTPTVADAERLAAVRTLQERAAAAPDLDHLLAAGGSGGRFFPGPAVAIMTIHAAKGLQFPVVFVTGLADGRFPVAVDTAPVFYTAAAIRDWVDDPAAAHLPGPAERLAHHLKEERRLAYVALTRAEAELILTRAARYGGEDAAPSRFLAEMGAPPLEPVSPRLADPVPAARSYLVRVAAAAEAPVPERVAAAVAALAADPAAVPLRRQAEPAPFAGAESLDLSASALEAYRDCPRQYYYAQVVRLPGADTVYLAFGEAVHRALEQFHTALRDGGRPGWPELAAWWEGALDRSRCETDGQYRQLLERGRVFLRRYHGWAAGRWRQILAVEDRFSVPYTDRTGRTHRLRGRYDLIALGPDGPEIIDFKTGHRKSTGVNKKPTGKSENDPQRKLQLGLYYLARFGGEVDPAARVTYVFLRHPDDHYPDEFVPEFNQNNEQVISCLHTAGTLQGMRDTVDTVIEGILANRFERRPEERKCSYCPFRHPCEVSPIDWF